MIEQIADALGFDIPKEKRGLRVFVFATIGGIAFATLAFVPLFIATAVVWPSAQGPLLAFAIAPLGFAIGTVVGAASAWRNEK